MSHQIPLSVAKRQREIPRLNQGQQDKKCRASFSVLFVESPSDKQSPDHSHQQEGFSCRKRNLYVKEERNESGDRHYEGEQYLPRLEWPPFHRSSLGASNTHDAPSCPSHLGGGC